MTTPDTVPDVLAGQNKTMISDLELSGEVHELFLIGAAQKGQARNGPYWRVDFRDRSGGIAGKIWHPLSQSFPELAAGMIAHVRGRVVSYRDQLELAVEGMRVLTEEESAALDLSLFMPASVHSPESMMKELLLLTIENMRHPPWLSLMENILADAEIGTALRNAAAAKAMHHAFAGGLLEHTLSVARLCMKLADHYPLLDRQALLAGAICHDLGKIWELSSGLAVEYTQAGKLIGHINILLERLVPFIRESRLEPELAEHLRHMILSHHGSYEFGSPRLPATPEALALHYADIMDAKLQQVEQALAGLEEGSWSAYVPSLERSLFRPQKTPAAPDGNAALPDEELEPELVVLAPERASCLQLEEEMQQNGVQKPPSPQEDPGPDEGEAVSPARKAGQPLPLFSQCSLLSKE